VEPPGGELLPEDLVAAAGDGFGRQDPPVGELTRGDLGALEADGCGDAAGLDGDEVGGGVTQEQDAAVGIEDLGGGGDGVGVAAFECAERGARGIDLELLQELQAETARGIGEGTVGDGDPGGVLRSEMEPSGVVLLP
jgi:hypothetical protein